MRLSGQITSARLGNNLLGKLATTLVAYGRNLVLVACAFFVLTMLMASTFATSGQAQTRSLKLYYLHTGEKATITYKRGGKYIQGGLKKVNRFLRDWRRNEPTRMDPRLLDLIWEVYKETGSKAYIHVISGYRSPKTNNMLRRRGRGVAKNSQHTLGKAMDFFLPDVKLAKLRKIGLIKQVGGVGYYPTSGSPFVHLDTGSVRHWPRMSRSQLVKVFPNGKTLHVPADRKPLKGYSIAKANYAKYKRGSGKIVISKEKDLPKKSRSVSKKKRSLFALFKGADDDEDKNVNTTPAPKQVKTTSQKVQTASSKDVFNPFAGETPESIQLAQLPQHGPIPMAAPREPIRNPFRDDPIREPFKEQETVLASLSDRQIENTSQVPTAPERAMPVEPLLNEPTPDEIVQTATDIADKLPEPEPLPEIPVAPAPSKSSIESRILLALADPLQPNTRIGSADIPIPDAKPFKESRFAVALKKPDSSFQVAALSPSEIEDLRSEVRHALATTRTFRQKLPISTKKPMTPLFAERRIVPPVDIPQTSQPTLLTALLPEEQAPEINIAPAIISKKISMTSALTARMERAPLEPIEPGARSKDKIAAPQTNPNRENIPANIDHVVLASLKIPTQSMTPTKNPRALTLRDTVGTASLNVASLIKENSDTKMEGFDRGRLFEKPPVTKLAQRNVSLSRFSMSSLGDNAVGRWALVKNASIREISEISPPAYGRNIIRELPSSVLTAGFSRTINGFNTDRFSGSSLEFLSFSKFADK